MVEEDEWKPVKPKVEKILTTQQIEDQKKQKVLEYQKYHRKRRNYDGHRSHDRELSKDCEVAVSVSSIQEELR
jgi:hypothetical protein